MKLNLQVGGGQLATRTVFHVKYQFRESQWWELSNTGKRGESNTCTEYNVLSMMLEEGELWLLGIEIPWSPPPPPPPSV